MTAVDLLKFGLSVVPCRSGTGSDDDKKPRISWKKYQTERPSYEQVEAWLQQWPDSNWAIVTGSISGIVVLDIDSEEGEQEVQRRGLPVSVSVRTRKGRHIYFRHPGIELKNWAKKIPGCDFRGDGGYVMAPGSVHPSGFVYEWIESIDDAELATMPAWLFDVTAQPIMQSAQAIEHPAGSGTTGTATNPTDKYVERAFASEIEKLRQARTGQRNQQLFSSAAALFEFVAGGYLGDREVETALIDAARTLDNDPSNPFTMKEIEAAIVSARKAGSNPRHVPEPTYKVHSNGTLTAVAGNGNDLQNSTPDVAPEAPIEDPFEGIYMPTWGNLPEPTPAILTLQEQRIGSVGNLTTIISAPGFGKSAICEALCAFRLDPTCDAFNLTVETELPVVYIDTERSKEDHAASWVRMTKRAGLQPGTIVDASVRFMSMKMIPTIADRRKKLTALIGVLNPGLLVLDTVTDFVHDVNDAAECNQFMAWLLAEAEIKGFAVLATIHQNPQIGNEKPRGHIGSEILRRAEANLILRRDEVTGERTLTTRFVHGKVRNADDRLETTFTWSAHFDMFVTCIGSAPQSSPLQASKMKELVDALFTKKSGYYYSALVEEVMNLTQTKERNAKAKVAQMKAAGLVRADLAGVYVRFEPPEYESEPF